MQRSINGSQKWLLNQLRGRDNLEAAVLESQESAADSEHHLVVEDGGRGVDFLHFQLTEDFHAPSLGMNLDAQAEVGVHSFAQLINQPPFRNR